MDDPDIFGDDIDYEVSGCKKLNVKVDEGHVMRLSKACLLDNTEKIDVAVCLQISVEGKQHVIGHLNPLSRTQQDLALTIHKDFKIFHTWSNGIVCFSGYQMLMIMKRNGQQRRYSGMVCFDVASHLQFGDSSDLLTVPILIWKKTRRERERQIGDRTTIGGGIWVAMKPTINTRKMGGGCCPPDSRKPPPLVEGFSINTEEEEERQ
ncbi:unnamed protein product [Lactuca virosa]|uniref:Nucleoplasmin-like domain-containing protein n=1 Tax=Lactuca virosa TaxID=75947 RepID=A0AAU9PAI1_9ASTR|nr:unnamed protein product [Lactuca virosa]